MVKRKKTFKLIEHLGSGGFAQTWRARVVDPELIDEWGLEDVAIKIPLSEQKERALKREVELEGSLYLQITEVESKNIVKYLGFDVYDGKIIIVLEYIRGGNLREVMGNIWRWKKVKVEDALTIVEGILKGLIVIHNKHIVHRDIKPENILIDKNIPKITDFGLSRILKSNEQASSSVGTLYYMSPELLFEGYHANFNTDIWSLGITLYEMICGKYPYSISKEMPIGKVVNIIKDESMSLKFPKFPDNIDIAPKLKNIISKALKSDPTKRYKTANELLQDIIAINKKDEYIVEMEIGKINQFLYDPAKAFIAEKQLKGIMKKFPDSPLIYLKLGEFYNKWGDYDKALEIFKKGIEKDSGNALLYWGIAMSYQKKNELKSAKSFLKKALEIGLEPSLERYAKMLLKVEL